MHGAAKPQQLNRKVRQEGERNAKKRLMFPICLCGNFALIAVKSHFSTFEHNWYEISLLIKFRVI